MSTTIYPTLITKIRTVLQSVSKIKVIYDYPASKITAYPCAIFFPGDFQNVKETNQDNFKVYNFKIYIVAGTTQKTLDSIISDILPKTLDDVLSAFDTGWDFSTIDGHRAWSNVDTGGWNVVENQDGLEVSAEINLSVKLLTNS